MSDLTITKSSSLTDKVKMVQVAMVRPNRKAIYAPSRLTEPFYTDRATLRAIADYGRPMLVSFEVDGISDPQEVIAYGYGFFCWYIVAPECEA